MYGLAIALFALLIVSTAVRSSGRSRSDMKEVRAVLIGMPTALGSVLALLWLTASIFGEHGAQPSAPDALLAFVAIIAIGCDHAVDAGHHRYDADAGARLRSPRASA